MATLDDISVIAMLRWPIIRFLHINVNWSFDYVYVDNIYMIVEPSGHVYVDNIYMIVEQSGQEQGKEISGVLHILWFQNDSWDILRSHSYGIYLHTLAWELFSLDKGQTIPWFCYNNMENTGNPQNKSIG